MVGETRCRAAHLAITHPIAVSLPTLHSIEIAVSMLSGPTCGAIVNAEAAFVPRLSQLAPWPGNIRWLFGRLIL